MLRQLLHSVASARRSRALRACLTALSCLGAGDQVVEDERRDPVRSTDAAIRFLNYLHEQFGSLYLAAAAYNGGPGRVARGLSRYADQLEGSSGEDVFFALAEHNYLRAETRDYVPKMIAAALVAKADKVEAGYVVRMPKAYPVYDETYKGMWHSPQNTVLLTTTHPRGDGPPWPARTRIPNTRC